MALSAVARRIGDFHTSRGLWEIINISCRASARLASRIRSNGIARAFSLLRAAPLRDGGGFRPPLKRFSLLLSSLFEARDAAGGFIACLDRELRDDPLARFNTPSTECQKEGKEGRGSRTIQRAIVRASSAMSKRRRCLNRRRRKVDLVKGRNA